MKCLACNQEKNEILINTRGLCPYCNGKKDLKFTIPQNTKKSRLAKRIVTSLTTAHFSNQEIEDIFDEVRKIKSSDKNGIFES